MKQIGKPYKFYHLLSSDAEVVNGILKEKHRLLLSYSKHTRKIGHFGEDLVADAVKSLRFTNIEVRKPLGKKDIDVWCQDPSGDFYWEIEVKNRRQQISEVDVADALYKAELASSKLKVDVRAAIVSSSVYDRIPESTIPIVTTRRVCVPNKKLFHIYKKSLGSWYIRIVNSLPSDLVESIREQLLEPHTTTEAYTEPIEILN